MHIIDVSIEKLTNGAWVISVGQDRDRHVFVPSNRAGFAKYSDAERYAVNNLKKLMRAIQNPPVEKKCKS